MIILSRFAWSTFLSLDSPNDLFNSDMYSSELLAGSSLFSTSTDLNGASNFNASSDYLNTISLWPAEEQSDDSNANPLWPGGREAQSANVPNFILDGLAQSQPPNLYLEPAEGDEVAPLPIHQDADSPCDSYRSYGALDHLCCDGPRRLPPDNDKLWASTIYNCGRGTRRFFSLLFAIVLSLSCSP